MAPRYSGHSGKRMRRPLFAVLITLSVAAGWILKTGQPENLQVARLTQQFGRERMTSFKSLPEMTGPMCEFAPVSETSGITSETLLRASLLQGAPQARDGQAPPRPTQAARDIVQKRAPQTNIEDPHFGFAGITVDIARNEVIIAEENISSIVIYDRMENTPPNAKMSEPKRMIGGEETFIEYACGVYVDPATGDVYSINNDTMNWLPVFGRDQKGNMKPKRKIGVPHTTAGMMVDEDTKELFLTIQDDHAVVVYDKYAEEEAPVKRVIQGKDTGMADPHGIGLDTKRGEIYVTNWGSNNSRPEWEQGKGGGGFGRSARRGDFPVGRNRTYPSSGNFHPASVTVYKKDAVGNVKPLREIKGPKTGLDWPTSVAIHPERGEIYVANDTGHNVSVFPITADGDVAPIRVIAGPKTMIKNPTGVFADIKNNELWVANFGSHSATVFPFDASGNATPKRIIRSGPPDAGSPMLGNPHTVAFDTKRNEVLVAN
jgi:DNA-binding beta-propeller fold protein YncE